MYSGGGLEVVSVCASPKLRALLRTPAILLKVPVPALLGVLDAFNNADTGIIEEQLIWSATYNAK